MQFDQTLEFIDQIQQAQTPEQTCETLLAVTRRFGLTAVLAGTVPDPRTPQERRRGHLLLNAWPSELVETYLSGNYTDRDRVVERLADLPVPLKWRETVAAMEREGIRTDVVSKARSFDLHDGVTFSLRTLEGDTVITSLAGKSVELSHADLGAIHLASTYAIGRAMRLRAKDDIDRRPELTPREIECIQWAALGKSEWEISQILGISEHTSEKHLLNAKSKLRAANRVQAIAEAMRHGFIT